jgi:hypothetical protein
VRQGRDLPTEEESSSEGHDHDREPEMDTTCTPLTANVWSLWSNADMGKDNIGRE